MVVPLACGAMITAVHSHAALFLGCFTSALFAGALPILDVFYVCMSATHRVWTASMPESALGLVILPFSATALTAWWYNFADHREDKHRASSLEAI
jgi:hypothetical protein